MRILIAKDVIAGLVFALFGGLGLFFGARFPIGRAAAMGPGYVPRLLCWGLIGLGAVILLRGIVAAHDPIERPHWRPLVLITLGILCFAALVDSGGLLAAGLVLIVAGAAGGPEFKPIEVAALAIGLLAAATGLFIWTLELPISVLPR